MDTKQALSVIKELSNLPYSDEMILRVIDKAINKIRCEALIQCDDEEVFELKNA